LSLFGAQVRLVAYDDERHPVDSLWNATLDALQVLHEGAQN
jgi:hypothetical protein